MVNVKELVLLSVLTTILFVSEQILSFLPSVQITFLLIILYSKVFKFKTIFIIIVHVLLDNLFNSSFNIIFIPFIILAYSIIPITLNTIFKRITKELPLALLSIVYSFIYCISYVIPTALTTNIKVVDYLIADLPFSIILAVVSFLTVLWLYKSLYKFLNNYIENQK